MKKGRQIRSCVLSRKYGKVFFWRSQFSWPVTEKQSNGDWACGIFAVKDKKGLSPLILVDGLKLFSKRLQHWHYSKSLHFGKRQKTKKPTLSYLGPEGTLQIPFLVGLKPFPNSSLWEIGKDRRPKLTWQVGLEIRRQHLGYFTPSLSFSKNVFFLCSTFSWEACADEDGEKWISLTFPILETFL